MIFTRDIFVHTGGAIDTSPHRQKYFSFCLESAPKHWIKNKKMMSTPAWINALLTHKLFEQLPLNDIRNTIGHFMGVGASGANLEELNNIIKDCLDESSIVPSPNVRFSFERFGLEGLAACNPLFAFQLMNNFTMCHASILEQLGGPNSVFYSRGIGTYMAFREACLALSENQTTHTLVGASDSALHPVTKAELIQQNRLDKIVPLEDGAAILALSSNRVPFRDLMSSDATPFLIRVRSLSIYGGNYQNKLSDHFRDFVASNEIDRAQTLFCAHSSQPSNPNSLHEHIREYYNTAVVNLNTFQGESLAATPSIAWLNGIEAWLQSDKPFLLVITNGLDQGLGILQLERLEA